MLKELKIILSKALNENTRNRVVKLNKETFLNLLKTEYSQAFSLYKDDIRFYRGDNDITYTDTCIVYPGTRIAKDSSNAYTILMSELLSSWSKYPKRNRSIIMTNVCANTERYGKTYVVLPSNNSNIAIAPCVDMWISFSNNNLMKASIDSLRELNVALMNLVKILTYYNNTSSVYYYNAEDDSDMIDLFMDADNVESMFEKCDEIARTLSPSDLEDIWSQCRVENKEAVFYFLNGMNEGQDLMDMLSRDLDPKSNHFKLKNLKDINIEDMQYSSHEMWTESECMFCDLKLMDEIA